MAAAARLLLPAACCSAVLSACCLPACLVLRRSTRTRRTTSCASRCRRCLRMRTWCGTSRTATTGASGAGCSGTAGWCSWNRTGRPLPWQSHDSSMLMPAPVRAATTAVAATPAASAALPAAARHLTSPAHPAAPRFFLMVSSTAKGPVMPMYFSRFGHWTDAFIRCACEPACRPPLAPLCCLCSPGHGNCDCAASGLPLRCPHP